VNREQLEEDMELHHVQRYVDAAKVVVSIVLAARVGAGV
jgi:hypothetical protein